MTTVVSIGVSYIISHLVDLHLCEPELCIQGEVPQNLRHACCGLVKSPIMAFQGSA